jgi:PLP dependent protein
MGVLYCTAGATQAPEVFLFQEEAGVEDGRRADDAHRGQFGANSQSRGPREPGAVTLLAVSKGQAPERVRQAAECGIRDFGENRVQEGKAKIGLCPGQVRWHMIGHLQSNKARDAVQFFRVIQSIDSLSIAQEVDRWAEKLARHVPVLLEVNVAGESSKFGYRPDRVREELAALNALRRLEIHGLMTVAPWTQDPEKVRPVFRRLRELKEECEQLLGAPLPVLSMGMSGDFEVAVEEGSTMIRIGTALFGPRSFQTWKGGRGSGESDAGPSDV